MLAPRHTAYSSPNSWLLWPTFRYRVVAPVVHEDSLNIFQEAVLGLVRAGLREEREMADLLGLAPELVSLVISDLRGQRLIDHRGVITSTGRAALQDGFAEPTSNVVTHVFQDVFTGTLLPIEDASPQWAQVEWRRSRRARLILGTAGAPRDQDALAIEAGSPRVDPPTADHIVEMVSRGIRSRRDGVSRDRAWTRSAPERVIKRVALIGAPDPTYVPLVVQLDKRGDSGAESTTWSVVNTMAGAPSTYLRRLVATRAQHSGPLRDRIDRLVGRSSEALLAEYDRLDVELRRRIGEGLESRFTASIRAHRELLELLTLIERDVERTRTAGDHSTEVASVVQRTWQVHELVLREIVARHRVPDGVLAQLSDPLAGPLSRSCATIGLQVSEHRPLRSSAEKLRRDHSKTHHTNTPTLLALCVLSAEAGDAEHPFRRLTTSYPTLITRLTAMSGDRNSIAHGGPDELNIEFAESAWRLTQDTVSAYLNLPLFTQTLAKETPVG
ncbi:helix-turn-helix domain-containing protein [Nocardia sp. NPDC004573]